MSETTHLTILKDDNFDDTINSANTPVLVDFFAEWCGPCKMLTPTLEKLALELTGKVAIYKINVDDSIATANKFQVTSIPTLIVFKDGQPISRHTGVANPNQIKTMLGL